MELDAKAKAARAAYQREWRKKNPEKHRQYVANYWARKAQEMEGKKCQEESSRSTGGR